MMISEVFTTADGEISVWLDGGIHVRMDSLRKDPVELSEDDALALSEALLKLVNTARE
ncbi:hypothetical protein OVA03_01285 [Asticcacaulis sp. SL142]|uniref:hypothetical protein n=1 Tax=Asticcacaulis sp. SL142 TaxID=2995155 RepID=UPI00226D2729|nr:hypothetical protein [Asticcacaulis sp. SL142]WAC48598.1 hypothetical protein OVA03_01285 [Asticcacaulis sp. SL142]